MGKAKMLGMYSKSNGPRDKSSAKWHEKEPDRIARMHERKDEEGKTWTQRHTSVK